MGIFRLVGAPRLELGTPFTSRKCSSQLSYAPSTTGADERSRTSTPLRAQPPQGCVYSQFHHVRIMRGILTEKMFIEKLLRLPSFSY